MIKERISLDVRNFTHAANPPQMKLRPPPNLCQPPRYGKQPRAHDRHCSEQSRCPPPPSQRKETPETPDGKKKRRKRPEKTAKTVCFKKKRKRGGGAGAFLLCKKGGGIGCTPPDSWEPSCKGGGGCRTPKKIHPQEVGDYSLGTKKNRPMGFLSAPPFIFFGGGATNLCTASQAHYTQ